MIKMRAIGPPIRLASMSPIVAQATPVSSALCTPRATTSGAHAMVVPWPPIKEVDPAKTPTGVGAPAIVAPAMPIVFCITM